MSLELKSKEFGKIEILPALQQDLKKFPKHQPIISRLDEPFGKAIFYDLPGIGLHVSYSEYHIKRPVTIDAGADQAVIELRIAMKKQILGKWEGFKEATIPEDHFCLCYSPTVVTHAEFPDPAFYSTWDIHFDIPFLTSIAKDYPVLQELLNKVDRKEPFQYRAEHYICTPEMKGAIARIMENGHSRASQAWNLTFSAGELLISVLEKIGGPMSKYANLIHNKYLIDRLMNAKTFIESFVTEKEVKPMELKEVYKKCQLNSSNLSYGFRTIFNTTPRRYYEDLRMDLGKKMLRETDHSIGHIALTLDYSNIAHYSDQFRVRFGESPLQYRLRFRKNRNPEDGKG